MDGWMVGWLFHTLTGPKAQCNGTMQCTIAQSPQTSQLARFIDSAVQITLDPTRQPYAYAQTVVSLSIDLT